MTTYITRTPEAPSNLKTEEAAGATWCSQVRLIAVEANEQHTVKNAPSFNGASIDGARAEAPAATCLAGKCAHWLWVEGEGVEWERERREGRGRFSLTKNRHIPTDVPDGWELDPTMGTQAAEFKRDEEVGLVYYIRRPVKVHPPRGICGLVHRVIQLERAP